MTRTIDEFTTAQRAMADVVHAVDAHERAAILFVAAADYEALKRSRADLIASIGRLCDAILPPANDDENDGNERALVGASRR